VNVLVALLDETHVHNQSVNSWFASPGRDWGVCAVAEMGFVRLITNPKLPYAESVEAARMALADLVNRPGYRYWPITATWVSLVAPFRERVFGHQQVTDALLLGLAIQAGGVLVTMDKGVRALAGAQLSRHVLVLE
jgi:toxin-antitoxin system PIN domain toxin